MTIAQDTTPLCVGCGLRDWQKFIGEHMTREGYRVKVWICRNCISVTIHRKGV